MMRKRFSLAVVLTTAGLAGWIVPGAAQQLMSPARETGQTVSPAFEGWYPNGDGTFSLSFGYFNRNSKEVVDVPVGPENFVSPGAQNQNQPTHFQPGRHWGVFAVKVPADFGDKTVVWTLQTRGETFEIPGRLHPNWQIDALEGEAGSGNTPPALRFAEAGPEGSGPFGAMAAAPLTATVGKPVTVTVWARDDGRAATSVATGGRGAAPVTVTWFKHQGPGSVTFKPPSARIPAAGGSAPTEAVFGEPGAYVLRVRANDASGVSGAGHAQCCWSNGFVTVTVSK
jgi:hypothetical protein